MTSEDNKRVARFPSVIAGTVYTLIFSLVMLLSLAVGVRLKHWPFIENLVGDAPFGDLGVLLAMADFLRSNPAGDAYENIVNYGYVPNYPLLLPSLLEPTGLGHDDVFVVGVGLAVAVTVALALLLFWALNDPSTEKVMERGAVLLIAFVSPPTMLLLERGNYDSLIFLLTIAACGIAVKSRLFASLVIWLAALIKLFPIGAVLAFARRGRGLIVPFGLLSLFAIYAVSILGELSNISTNTPRPHWLGFGWRVFAGYAEEFFPGIHISFYLAFTVIINLIAAALGFWFIRNNSTRINELAGKISQDTLSEMLFITGTLILLTAFAIGNAFDYRLIFLLLPLIAVVRNDGLNHVAGRLIVLLIAGVLFWSLATYQLQPFGDVLVAIAVTILSTIAWKIMAARFQGPINRI